MRGAAAFSTLGYFSDPVLSTAVDRETMELVATVLHELAHNTLYVKNHTAFDESFASFVGYRGAQAFFRARGDSVDAARAAARWRDERILDVFYAELARRLDSAYASIPGESALEHVRTTLFKWARTQLAGPVGQSLETYDWRWFATAPLNNAVVIAQRTYRMNLNLFDEIYLQNDADIAETIRAIEIRVFTQPGQDPYQALYSRPGVPGTVRRAFRRSMLFVGARQCVPLVFTYLKLPNDNAVTRLPPHLSAALLSARPPACGTSTASLRTSSPVSEHPPARAPCWACASGACRSRSIRR